MFQAACNSFASLGALRALAGAAEACTSLQNLTSMMRFCPRVVQALVGRAFGWLLSLI
jgi:hypothetical protein